MILILNSAQCVWQLCHPVMGIQIKVIWNACWISMVHMRDLILRCPEIVRFRSPIWTYNYRITICFTVFWSTGLKMLKPYYWTANVNVVVDNYSPKVIPKNIDPKQAAFGTSSPPIAKSCICHWCTVYSLCCECISSDGWHNRDCGVYGVGFIMQYREHSTTWT